jgi:hypothetical protein
MEATDDFRTFAALAQHARVGLFNALHENQVQTAVYWALIEQFALNHERLDSDPISVCLRERAELDQAVEEFREGRTNGFYLVAMCFVRLQVCCELIRHTGRVPPTVPTTWNEILRVA